MAKNRKHFNYINIGIRDEKNHVIGHLSLTGSHIAYSPRNSKVWHRLSIKDFEALMKDEGKKMKDLP